MKACLLSRAARYPSIKGTSGLSPYLALGIISVHQLLALIQQRHPDILKVRKQFVLLGQ